MLQERILYMKASVEKNVNRKHAYRVDLHGVLG